MKHGKVSPNPSSSSSPSLPPHTPHSPLTMTFLSSLWSKPEGAPTSAPSTAPTLSTASLASAPDSVIGNAVSFDDTFLAQPGAESDALSAVLVQLAPFLDAPSLPAEDPWTELLCNASARAEIVLRVLRYQSLHIARTAAQIRAILAWRASASVCKIEEGAMRGLAAGLPVMFVPILGKGRSTLMYACARMYQKRDVIAASTERSFVRFFEHILYAADGIRATGAVAVVDFCDISIREVDLPTTRRGINLFLQYYPESFSKLLFVNYPRFIFHFWKLLKPLLDVRTVERVEWCETPQQVPKELGKWFAMNEIPTWLGGGNDRLQPDLLIGTSIDERELTNMFSMSCTG